MSESDRPRWAGRNSAKAAVTRRGGRAGEGAGFADLGEGVCRELGLVDASTPIATTVNSSQVVEDAAVVMESQDSALDFIATERERIETPTPYPQPEGVAGEKIRRSIESRKRAP